MANELVNVGGVWTLKEAAAGGTPRVLTYREDAGGTPPTPGAGVLGQSMSFNGSSDYFDHVGHRSVYDFKQDSDFSVAGWIKTSVTDAVLVSHYLWAGSYPFGWQWRITSNKLRLYFAGGSTSYKMDAKGTDTVNNGNWRHVAVTYNGSIDPGKWAQTKFYVDGSQGNPTTGTNLSTSHYMQTAEPLRLGAHNNAIDYAGDMDDMALWNVVLTPTQITSLYNSGTGNLASTEPTGLVAHWKCDTVVEVNAGGGIYREAIPDASGNGLDMHYRG